MDRDEWLAWVDTLCWIGEGAFSPAPAEWDYLEFAAEWRRALLEKGDHVLDMKRLGASVHPGRR